MIGGGARRAILGMLAAAALLGSAATARASDQLDGTYVLDPAASDDPSEMMKLLGVGAVKRALARTMRTRMVFDGEPERATITLTSPIGDNTSVLPTDGSPIEVDGGQFGAGTLRARWIEDGAALVVESDTELADGRKVHNVTTRRLEDADTLLQQFEVSVDGGDPVVLRRVFRRTE